MTLPTFVAVSSGGDASGTNLVVSRPGAAVNNRVRLVVIYLETSAAVSATGWTEITGSFGQNLNGGLPDYWTRVFYHRDDGSDPASWTFTWGGANVWRGYVCCAYDDVVTAGDPTELANYNEDEGGSNTITGTGITTAGADRKALFAGDFFYNTATAFGNPNAGTRRGNIGALAFFCDEDRPSAGPTGDYTIQSSPVEARAWSASVIGLIGVTAVADMPPVTADLGNETDRVAVADDAEARGFVFWLMPDDVVVEEMPPATADLGNETDRVADDAETHGFVFWQMPEDVEEALIGATVLDTEHDTDSVTDARIETGWVGWQAPEDVEEALIGATVFEESEAVATEALEWFAAATEDLVEEPPIAAALITDLFESDDTEHNWTAWQVPDDVLPEDFMPGALLVMAEVSVMFDDSPFNWLAGPNYLGGLPGFTLGLVRVTSGVKAAGVTSGLKAAKVATMYKGVRDGTTD